MTPTRLQLQRWQALNSEQQQSVLALHIPPEQIEFAGTMAQAVAVGEGASLDEVAGLAVLHAEAQVGFVVLCRGSRLPAWAPTGAVALRAMRIDSREQGKGHGRHALALVETWLAEHWPVCPLLALCVDDQNLAARRAYEVAGFTEYAEPKAGRIGLVRYLSKSLREAASA
ncbi:GNAT family N-acetyltransferase [Hydrogenophaga sp. D2P1]|uniref:GNAT family N-acetyltransferase n=1 Tax=Hydrogenophaga aromaticivorans TaxID=2610898 RepID=A0A7Y8H1T4_9BURK|nr:GNAT family N-acetyltransferase [Hydrogenophaga aromaticivorans]NWF48062.1 GNAT family N-acetyltransferase [Hydrogenophaga aromaticivorans]